MVWRLRRKYFWYWIQGRVYVHANVSVNWFMGGKIRKERARMRPGRTVPPIDEGSNSSQSDRNEVTPRKDIETDTNPNKILDLDSIASKQGNKPRRRRKRPKCGKSPPSSAETHFERRVTSWSKTTRTLRPILRLARRKMPSRRIRDLRKSWRETTRLGKTTYLPKGSSKPLVKRDGRIPRGRAKNSTCTGLSMVAQTLKRRWRRVKKCDLKPSS